jgi:hypothetical protein
VSQAQIGKLEALLARVQRRAAEPRVVAVAAAVAEVAPAAHPVEDAIPAPAPVVEVLRAAPPAPPVAVHVAEPAEEDLESTQQREVPSRKSPARTEAEIVVEVEVQAATPDIVVAVPVEEVPAPAPIPEATESRERLVAASPVVERSPSVPEMDIPVAPAPEPEPAPEIVAQVIEEVADVEEVEEAPISSRRPVAPEPEERLAEMAFGAAEPQPPRHTPPPESGRLPAAPEVEFEGDVTGVRSASKPPASVDIVPEATVANIAASDAVADIVGQPKPALPLTFVAALDASIAL